MFKQKYMILLICLVCFSIFLNGCLTTMKADFFLSQEKYDQSIHLFNEYLEKKPHAILPRSKLGFAYFKVGRVDEAITEFKKVLSVKTNEPYSLLYLGLSYLNNQEYSKAIETWQRFKNKKQPYVEKEIKKQLTLLLMAESQRAAKNALRNEKKLNSIKPEANTIAVCSYKDFSSDKSLQAFQKGLSAMVITDLSKIKSFKVIERLRLQALLKEMALGQTGIVDEKSAPRVGRLLKAENIVIGNLSTSSIKVNTSIKGNANGTSSVSVTKSNFFKLPGRIVQDLTKIIGIKMTKEETEAIGVPHTTVYRAFISFGEALDALDAGHWQKAKNLFAIAVKLDPDFELARKMGESCPDKNSPNIDNLADLKPNQIEAAIHEAQKSDEAQSSSTKNLSSGSGGCH